MEKGWEKGEREIERECGNRDREGERERLREGGEREREKREEGGGGRKILSISNSADNGKKHVVTFQP